MKLYCIVDDVDNLKNPDTYRLLKEAAETRGLDWQVIEAYKADPSQIATMQLEPGSIVYRQSISRRGVMIEAMLYRDNLRMLYKHGSVLFARGFDWGSTIQMAKLGLPIIPTVFMVSADLSDKLGDYAEQLGGFPIILKASGGSHGSGVMRLDSIESLKSVVNFVAKWGTTQFVLRRYIANARHIRCVVVGDKVADAIEYMPVDNDFRTNAVAVPKVKAFQKDDAIFELAQKAVAAHQLEFGGVDILVAEDGKAYIAEVNFPCNFARNQLNTGADIAGMIIDHLSEKQVTS